MITLSIKRNRGNVLQFEYRFTGTAHQNSDLGVFITKELEELRTKILAFIEDDEVVRQTQRVAETVSAPEVQTTLKELRDLLAVAKDTGDPVDLEKVSALKQKLLDQGIQTTPRSQMAPRPQKQEPAKDEGFSVEGVKVTGGKFDAGSKEQSDADIQEAAEVSRWKRRQEALAALKPVSPEAIIKAGGKKKEPAKRKPAVGDPYQ